MSLQTRRWVNPSQPQTLQIAVFLLYFDAVFGVLRLLPALDVLFRYELWEIAYLLAPLAGAVAAYFIANEKKWGYWLGVGVSVAALLPYAFALLAGYNILGGQSAIGLLFAVAQLALLLHPMSQSYQKTWFE